MRISSIYQWQREPREQDANQHPSQVALADLARRQAIPDTRDNTGRLLGDPPPGRSALDRKIKAQNIFSIDINETAMELLFEKQR